MRKNYVFLKQLIVFAVLIFGFSSAKSQEITVELPSTKDTYIRQHDNNRNFGDQATMSVSLNDGGSTRDRGMIYFDLSSIPENSTIMSAELTLTQQSGSYAENIDIYFTDIDWDEMSVVYNDRPGYIEPSSRINVGTSSNTPYTWDLKEMIQHAVNNTSNYYGFIIRALLIIIPLIFN